MGVDVSRVERLVRELLEAIGEEPQRPGLRRTPQRVAEAYGEFFGGLDADPVVALGQPISVSRGPEPDTLSSGPVILRGVDFRSMCEHHLLPFRGVAHIAYLPGELVVGLGGLARVVEVFAARPQVQERLGEQVCETIHDALAARGTLVVLEAGHGCMTMRGAQQVYSTTVTVAARGILADPAERAEIIALIGGAADHAPSSEALS